MRNLTLLELAAIAVALDKEGPERKRREKSKENLSLFTKN
jgi:hypothetical protein